MYFKRVLSIVMILALLVAVPVAAQEGSDSGDAQTQQSNQENKVAAIVNGEEISMQELDQFAGTQQLVMSLYRSNPDFTQVLLQTEAGQNVITEFQKSKLDQLITQKLLAQEANERGLELSQEEQNEIFNQQVEGIKQQNDMNDEQLEEALQNQGIESIEAYKETFIEQNRESLIINKLRENVTSQAEVTEEEMQNYYDNNQSEFEVQDQAQARHILLEDKETAEEVMKKLENGGDFAELAEEYSTGPSAEEGGNLGFVSKDQNIAQKFKEAVFALDVGGRSEIVETQYGFHIIEVTDRKEGGLKSFDEVKEQIRKQLANQKGQKLWDEFVRKLRDEATIEKKL